MRRVYRILVHLWRQFHNRLAVRFGGTLASLPFPRAASVLRAQPGNGRPLGAKVAVFCHFDPRRRVRGTVRRYIAELGEAGLSVVFVTNSGLLQAEDLAWTVAHAAFVVERRNIGLDFAAWRDGMRCAGLPAASTDMLLLSNDSVYGPFQPIASLLDRFDFAQADVWGATDSWQRHYHLQSYFIAFGRRAMAHPAFIGFWNRVLDVRSKLYIVERYEVGLSRVLLAEGLRCRALWPYGHILGKARELAGSIPSKTDTTDAFDIMRHASLNRSLHAASHRFPLNPTAELWQTLLAEGFPFLKRELLVTNPQQVADVSNWVFSKDLIGATAIGLIEEDLAGRGAYRYP